MRIFAKQQGAKKDCDNLDFFTAMKLIRHVLSYHSSALLYEDYCYTKSSIRNRRVTCTNIVGACSHYLYLLFRLYAA